jgi:hypothetical protein
MPQSDDDDNYVLNRRGEGKSDDLYDKAESKSSRLDNNDSDQEHRRSQKWLAFARPRLVFGFDHLGPSNLPSMSTSSRGISLCFERINGWQIPQQMIRNIRENHGKLSVQLSLSLFHLNSSSFFGSTWMGRSVILDEDSDRIPDTIDMDYFEIVYMISRLTDPSCVGVVEIVVSTISRKSSLITSQFG